MLCCEPLARAPESAHHLVIDEQDAVFVAQRAKSGIVIVRRNQQTIRTCDSLHHNGGDVRGTLHLNDFLDVRNALARAGLDLLAEGAAVTVGIKRADDAGYTRFDWPTPRITGSSHRAHGRAVIRTI